MDSDRIFTVKLHEHKELTTECAEVLNEEWPRSLTARCLMLEKSNDKFPYCIVLLEKAKNGGQDEVVGHSRLCKVYGVENACFVESVVIAKKRRGQGLGRLLMEESEKHAKRLGCSTMYLTTHDKQDFYAHINYVFCDPIVSFGSTSNLISDEMAQALFGSANISQAKPKDQRHDSSTKETTVIKDNSNQHDSREIDSLPPSFIPPPPPPPPSSGPPPPPPPPPQLKHNTGTANSSVLRMDPSSVFWMKKVLMD